MSFFSTGTAGEGNVSSSNEESAFVISVDTDVRNKLVKRGDAESEQTEEEKPLTMCSNININN
jgi:hypothetical protein